MTESRMLRMVFGGERLWSAGAHHWRILRVNAMIKGAYTSSMLLKIKYRVRWMVANSVLMVIVHVTVDKHHDRRDY